MNPVFILMAGYFLNGGIGALMQPSASSNSGPPATHENITTQGGSVITTQSGSNLQTG